LSLTKPARKHLLEMLEMYGLSHNSINKDDTPMAHCIEVNPLG